MDMIWNFLKGVTEKDRLFTYSDIDDFGKTVFLTKSEAEQKLKEMDSD